MACPSAKRQRMGQLDAYDSSEETDTSEEAPPVSQRAAAYAPHVGPALDAFWTLDPDAEVHGSHQVGLWDEYSDLDLLTTQPLHQLLRRLRTGGVPSSLTLLEHVAQARVPRLLLKHRSGVVLDVVEAKRDPYAVAKDRFVAQRLADANAAPLARRIKALVRRWGAQMPREEGYPNCFLFLLIGFWYLARQRPPEPDGGGKSQEQREERLFQGWLNFLVESASAPMIFDLREKPEDVGGAEAHWKIDGVLTEPFAGAAHCRAGEAGTWQLTHFQVPNWTSASIYSLWELCALGGGASGHVARE
eukprot:s186_g18.t1